MTQDKESPREQKLSGGFGYCTTGAGAVPVVRARRAARWRRGPLLLPPMVDEMFVLDSVGRGLAGLEPTHAVVGPAGSVVGARRDADAAATRRSGVTTTCAAIGAATLAAAAAPSVLGGSLALTLGFGRSSGLGRDTCSLDLSSDSVQSLRPGTH